MRREHEDRIDPNKPALVVLYGATKRKFRPLNGDIIVLGRTPGCDIGLVSPEVAPVHSVIVRLADGWRIRDCSGRATRVNGKAIQDEPLRNGDVIQIGTFSFEAHLPTVATAVPPDPVDDRPVMPTDEVVRPHPYRDPRSEHLKASRQRLGKHALALRRRLREALSRESELARRERDLELMEGRLRASSQERIESTDAQKTLDQRKTELEHYARHLRRLEQRLRDQEAQQARQAEVDRADYEADLVKARVESEGERKELAELRHHVEQRHIELEQTAELLEEELTREKEQLENDREQVSRERAYLDQQRQELLQLRTQIERQAVERRPLPPVTSHDTQLDDAGPDRLASARRLLHQLAERRKTLATTPAPSQDFPKA